MPQYSPIARERAEAIEMHLDALLEPLVASGALSDEILSRLTEEARQFVIDCLGVSHVFLDGFAALRTGRLAPSSANSPTLLWTREYGSNLRSGRIIADMLAFELCAMLDETLPKLVKRGKQSAAFRATWERFGGTQIVIRPTGKRLSAWPEALLDLFGVPQDSFAVEALRDMVNARNCAAHELPRLDQHAWGEHLSMWGKASLWLLSSLSRSLDSVLLHTKKPSVA